MFGKTRGQAICYRLCSNKQKFRLLNLTVYILFVCLFLWVPSFEGNWVSLMGFSLMSKTGVDGNAPYQAKELQITTLANPWIQKNFLPPRPVQS